MFEYRSYAYRISSEGLHIQFDFWQSEEIVFHPKLFIPANVFLRWDSLSNDQLNNLVFHVGMIELISYWKLACSPKVLIRPHKLDPLQVQWWTKLYYHGLGEFLFLNGIAIEQEDLMQIESFGTPLNKIIQQVDFVKTLVPVGGGKDSVVTLELLSDSDTEVFPLVLNMNPAMERTISNTNTNPEKVLKVKRVLDPLLLEMNDRGFLNGHTPFSALLAFVSVLVASASGIANIALSNENSANESTVPGTKINHQYSKSFEFESDFRWYCETYVHEQVNYFSFLRPLNEFQIAGLFSGFERHHSTFRSCNVGSKRDVWCGKCPKCLFTFIILSPFISHDKLNAIFGQNLLKEADLEQSFYELTGQVAVKPFECVGTPDEVNLALNYVYFSAASKPLLLKEYNFRAITDADFTSALSELGDEHALKSQFLDILKNAIHAQLVKKYC